jgi:hypothetical protein
MSDQLRNETLSEELQPQGVNRRRTALGRGLGALLMRSRLESAAAQRPKLNVPAWAEGFEPEQKDWIKKVIQRAR